MKIPPFNAFVEEIIRQLNPDLTLQQLIKCDDNKITVDNRGFITNSKIHIFGVGKAAAYQVQALKNLISRSSLSNQLGICVALTKHGHGCADTNITQIEGDHPNISQTNLNNSKLFLKLLNTNVRQDDILFFILSGGASALLELPIPEISLEKLTNIYNSLLRSGLNIHEMNQVRKSLSLLKNGGLWHHIPTNNVIQLVTCDIPSGETSDVGSGPLMFRDIDYIKVNSFLSTHNVTITNQHQTPLRDPFSVTIQSASTLLKQLQQKFSTSPYKIYDCPLDQMITDILSQLPSKNEILLSGGEAVITVPANHGLGGRNTHATLELARHIFSNTTNHDIHILCMGTDGTDGDTNAAGAYINYSLYNETEAIKFLTNYDSYSYFKTFNSLIKTGTTKSNVMDVRFLWRS